MRLGSLAEVQRGEVMSMQVVPAITVDEMTLSVDIRTSIVDVKMHSLNGHAYLFDDEARALRDWLNKVLGEDEKSLQQKEPAA